MTTQEFTPVVATQYLDFLAAVTPEAKRESRKMSWKLPTFV